MTVCAVENPGWKIRLKGFAIAQLLRLFRPQQAILERLLFDPRDVNPRPIIPDFDVDLAPFVIGTKGQYPLRRFARADPDLRRFDAVVARIADQVHQRILDGLDDGPVEFRLRSVHL